MKRSILLCFILIFLILVSSQHATSSPILVTTEDHQALTSSGYLPHAPISITGNDDFEAQGWLGNGTPGNPYIIEGLNITADTTCVSITGTTAYFEIKNCLIVALRSKYHTSIYFDRAPHGTIQNCIIDANYTGVSLVDSSICTLSNNTISSFHYGIRLYASTSCILTKNRITSEEIGLSVYLADNSIFVNNTIKCKISGIGFWLGNSDKCVLVNNTFSDGGLEIYGSYYSYWLQDVTDNWVNGKSLGYLKSVRDVTIDGSHYGQVILVNCTNVTITRGVFTSSTVGIQLAHCHNCTLANNTATKSYFGFHEYASDYCILTENVAANNSGSGFQVDHSSYCTLTNNYATGGRKNGFGFDSVWGCLLVNNTAVGNSGYGFYLTDSSDYSTLTNNTASSNSASGFFLSGEWHTLVANAATDNSDNGFYLEGWWATLTDNIATNNSGSGFYIRIYECTMTFNTAKNNSQYGIYLGDAAYNCILYQNRIGYNGISNARDDGRSNQWDDGVWTGNYWSDYKGSWRYAIPGSAGSVDRCPFDFDGSSTALSQRLFVPILAAGFGFVAFLTEVICAYSKRRRQSVMSHSDY